MKKLYVLILITAIVGSVWVLWKTETAKAPASSGAAPTNSLLTSDLYPLYAKVTWGDPAFEQVKVGTTTYSGASASTVAATSTMDPGAAFTPFEDYYAQKLAALGWVVANNLAAGGHTGGQTGYTKDGMTILTRFNIAYHTTPADAPSSCPCDVTLSVFSGN